MCGITGFYTIKQKISEESMQNTIDVMTDSIHYRGPDSRGTWVNNQTGIALGHRRLAIRDLSPSGHQPMFSSCGRFVTVYNGEIYSHTELAKELAQLGRCVKGSSDTEVIIEACAQWGVETTINKLIGMFAIAIYDIQHRILYLARDRLGKKPLYWGYLNGNLFFGSELKALREFKFWDPQLDRNALAAFMRHNYIPAPHSIYKGIQKLEPGCFLQIGPEGEPQIKRFWDFRAIVEKSICHPQKGNDIELLDKLDYLLQDAVQRRMVSDVPLGTLLSGGIDSSLITALMAEQSASAINTYSIGFAEKEYDESGYAREIAKHLGTCHTELYAEPVHALELVDKLNYWYDEPFADSSQIPTTLVCQLARQHVTVALSGDGGDELFAGYSRYTLGLETWQRANIAPYLVRQLMSSIMLMIKQKTWESAGRMIPKKYRPTQFGYKLHQFAHAIRLNDPDSLYRQRLSHWQEPDNLVIHGHEPKGILWDESLKQTIPHFLDRMQFLDTMTYLPDDILTKVDRASMSVALEMRVPLLDHRVVELAWQLPRHMKLRDGQTKWALRQLLYKRVPQKLIERPKMGFGVPLEHWLRGPLREWSETLLSEPRLKSQGLFNPQLIRERWLAHLGGSNWAYPLWNVLMVQSWLDANPEVSW